MKLQLLTTLRDKQTDLAAFRTAADRLSELIAAEIALSMPLEMKRVETPLGPAEGACCLNSVVLIPILRAGMVMLPAFLRHFCNAKVGFLGMRRDEKTAQPILYYEHLPKIDGDEIVMLLDPMIATGGSALLALDKIAKAGAHPSRIHLAGIIGALEGLQRIKKSYPYLNLSVVAEDPELNAQKFIVPGLGDFGDRYFGT